MCAIAQERHLESMIITFDRHPREVIHSDYVPQLLSSLEEKMRRLRQSMAQQVEMLHFTTEMSKMSASDFMRKVLRDRLDVSVLVMGYDHHFGHGGGRHEDYVNWGLECGIEVLQANELNEDKISSSRIRSLLQEGRISEANALLGYPYSLEGPVVRGHQVGRLLGFPTANLGLPQEKLLPVCGVYAVRATLSDGTSYPAMLNIGSRPTLQNGDDISVEVHLLNFSGDLYGKEIQVELVARLREECHFLSTEALREQMRKDAAEAIRLLEA